MKLKMFKRANGTFGVRNRIAVIPTVACVNHVAEKIAAAVDLSLIHILCNPEVQR